MREERREPGEEENESKAFPNGPLGAKAVKVPLVHVYKQHTDEAFQVITASTPVPVYQYSTTPLPDAYRSN